MSSRPVLLVHGFLADHRLMWPLANKLQRRGQQVHLTPLMPLCIQDVTQLAAQLYQRIEAVQQTTGASQVDLVGASQGGIIATWCATHLDQWTSVRRVVTVGSPFQGAPAARAFAPLVGWIAPGLRQLVPNSPLLRDLAQAQIPRGALHTLGIPGDVVAPPDRCTHPAARNYRVNLLLTPLQHQYMMVSPAVADTIVEALTA